MTPLHFHIPVEIFREEGALKRCGSLAAQYGQRALILTGAHAAEQSHALTDALESMKQAKVEAVVFPYISPNPTVAQCRAAAEAAEAFRASSILAIGGGSVMDAAKAAAWIATNRLHHTDALFEGTLRHKPLPLILCGTTAGTGSEVSAVAVITDDTGRKHSLKHPNCFANYVLADPRYTDTMPRSVTVSTALDALAHTVEGALNPSCNDFCRLMAHEALAHLTEGLTYLCEHELPDRPHRDSLYDASLLAGMVLSECGTAFPHPMGYVLTERYDVPHGQACAVFLPALLDVAKEHAPERAEDLFAHSGGEATLRRLLDTLCDVHVTMDEETLAYCRERFADLPHYARVPGGFDADRAVALCRRLFS